MQRRRTRFCRERARILGEEVAGARAAKDWVAAKKNDASHIEDGLGDLRQLPLSNEEMANLHLRAETLDGRRAQLDAAIEALEYVSSNAETLDREEAPRRLDAEQGLVPALKDQLREAETLQQTAEEKAAQAETQYDAETAKFLTAESRYDNAKKAHESAAEHFRAAEALVATACEVTQREQELASSNSRRDALLTAKGGQERGLSDAQQHYRSTEEKFANERREAEPARKRWEDPFNRAMRDGLVANC